MNYDHVQEAARSISVRKRVDVVVVGGGLGGVSAAVAAARAGAKTMLIERNGFPGGVAIAGMCCSIFPRFYTANHELIMKGNALEFTERLARAGGRGPNWHKHKGHIIFDMERGKLTLINLLEEAGVEYLFDTLVTNVFMDANRIRGVFIDSKSGTEAIMTKVVVDATGDADIAYFCGAPLHTLYKGLKVADLRSPHTYCFRMGNVDVDKFVQHFIDNPDQYPPYMDVDWDWEEALAFYEDTGTFLFPHGGGMQLKLIKEGVASGEYKRSMGVIADTIDALQMHAIRDIGIVHFVTGACYIYDLDVAKITQAMTDGKRVAFHVTEYFRKHIPGFEKAYVAATADDLGMRVTRWIDGEFVFMKDMSQKTTRFKDTIGRAPVLKYVVKNKARGAWIAQVSGDESYDIPYRCLLPRKIDGLLMGAGRSVSVDNPLILRTMVMTMAVGQGAGVGGAISARDNVTPKNVNIATVQKELRKQGVNL